MSGPSKSKPAGGRRVVHKTMKGTINYESLAKEIRLLQSHEGRKRTGLYCVEGIRFLFQARKARVPIKKLIVCDAILTGEVGRRLIRDIAKQNVPVERVPPEVFYALSRYYTELSYDGPVILFMGGERKGLSEQALAMCDEIVKFPMVGTADSLNLGVATSLMLYEVFNQRRKDNAISLRAPATHRFSTAPDESRRR